MDRRAFLYMMAVAAMATQGCAKMPSVVKSDRRVLTLGFDGMDPELLAGFMQRAEFPNFEKLMKVNGIRSLGTSTPPQSPVAWSDFITGKNPGGHAIFDFIHRVPEHYIPYLSTSRTTEAERVLSLGKWKIPLKGGGVELLRKGTAFWEILEREGVPSTIFRVPSNFPPVASGRSLSGMGTPDLLGGYGSFSFFTETELENQDEITGGNVVNIKRDNGFVKCVIDGPVNAFKKDAPVVSSFMEVWTDITNPSAKISLAGKEFILKQGEWSDWITLEFPMISSISKITGTVLVYLKQVHPHLQIYVSPIQIDPQNPAMPITNPPDYCTELVKKTGLYYTQGMPEDTKALDHGVFTDSEYLDQMYIVHNQVKKMFDYELSRFDTGYMFYYFSSTDLGSHMLWSAMDETHPMHDSRDPEVKDAMFKLYLEMDRMLGIALEKLDDRDTIIVISDHGFAPFKRAFSVNTWLKDNGYLALLDEFSQGEYEYLENVDWSRTRAYALGFNSIYINQAGREGQGIVVPGKSKDELVKEIAKKLEQAVDPKTGWRAITKVYIGKETYSGDYVDEAPDLVVGYNRGYRGSWETAIGKVPLEVFSDNTQKWSGDHLMDPAVVPGILFSNKKIAMENPHLYDIPVTILKEFGIQKEEGMIGSPIFEEA